MEYVPGRTLRDVIRQQAPLSPARALDLLAPVLSALSAAHDAGIVHRDIKPENVLIADDGTVKVADFGLARAVTTTGNTATQGLLMGTVSYLAPELVTDGSADARSDVYSAGILLYELLTGSKPHTGDTPIQVAYAHVHADVPPPSLAQPRHPAVRRCAGAAGNRPGPGPPTGRRAGVQPSGAPGPQRARGRAAGRPGADRRPDRPDPADPPGQRVRRRLHPRRRVREHAGRNHVATTRSSYRSSPERPPAGPATPVARAQPRPQGPRADRADRRSWRWRSASVRRPGTTASTATRRRRPAAEPGCRRRQRPRPTRSGCGPPWRTRTSPRRCRGVR